MRREKIPALLNYMKVQSRREFKNFFYLSLPYLCIILLILCHKISLIFTTFGNIIVILADFAPKE